MNANVTKSNGVKLFALVAVFAMVFAGAAVMMSDDGVSAAPSKDPTYLSGAITSTQEFGDGTEVVVNGELTIPTGMALIISGTGKLTVNAGATIEIQAGGQLIFQQTGTTGAYKNPTVVIDGDIVAKGTISDTYTGVKDKDGNLVNAQYFGAIVNNTVYDKTAKTGVFLNGNITLERGAELWTVTDDVTLSENDQNVESGSANVIKISITGTTDNKLVKPTVKNDNAETQVNGQIVMGSDASISVTKRSGNVSKIYDQNILMTEGSTFDLNGHIKDVGITTTGSATYRTESSVTLTHDGTYDDKSTSKLTFTVTNQPVTGCLYAYDDTNYDTKYTIRQYILNIEGEVAANDTITVNAGAAYDVNGSCAFCYSEPTENPVVNLVPSTVSVTGNLTVASDGALDIDTGAHFLVSGNLTVAYSTSTETAGKLTIDGKLAVTGTVVGTYVETGEGTKVGNITKTAGTGTGIIVESGSVQITDLAGNFDVSKFNVWGTSYTVEGTGSDDPVAYIMNFADAVAGATAAEVEDVYVYAYGAQNRTTAEYAADNGAYVIETEITIPDFMTLNVENALVIGENGVLILEDGSSVEIPKAGTNYAIIWNDGKVIDYGGAMGGFEKETQEFDPDFSTESDQYQRFLFSYEVKKTTDTDTEYYVTYTSLAIAIDEAQAGETIDLNGEVKITEDLTIPADVTVVADEAATTGITVEGATLTVNGVLDMNGTVIAVKPNTEVTPNVDGKIVVNNYIAQINDSNKNTKIIAGAYFNGTIGDYDNVNFIASGAVAGANSATASAEGVILFGKLSMGAVTFTQGENQSTLKITVVGQVSGDVTLVGNDMEFAMTGENASFTGSISSAVTAGTSTIEFDKASGNTVAIDYSDNGETVTTTMSLDGTLKGTATISAGAVTAGSELKTSAYDGINKVKTVLTVGTGATLDVIKTSAITVEAAAENGKSYDTLVVDGTLAYADGRIVNTSGIIDINGSMTVAKALTVGGTVDVTGDVAVAENVTLNIANMIVGDAKGAAGTVTGSIDFDSSADKGIITAYPASNVSGAQIAVEDGQSTADVTAFYINGDLYMTTYTTGAKFGDVISDDVELVGFIPVKADAWYDNAEMNGSAIGSDEDLSDLSSAYAKAAPSQALVYVSVGANMTVYIDDVRYGNGGIVALDVGQHTVSVQVNAGYTGEASVLFNGTAVSGTFEVTPEMADEYKVVSDPTSSNCVILSVTGNISVDTGATGGDGMGLTEILLVILVILIVVMAIMVALRLMRS